jgi:hypothetical protein
VECLWLERVDFVWVDIFCGTVLSSSDNVVSLEAGRRTTPLTWENLDWKEDYIEEIGVKEQEFNDGYNLPYRIPRRLAFLCS